MAYTEAARAQGDLVAARRAWQQAQSLWANADPEAIATERLEKLRVALADPG